MEVRFLLIFQIIQKHEDMHAEWQINLQYMHLHMSHIHACAPPPESFLFNLRHLTKWVYLLINTKLFLKKSLIS